MTDREIPSAVPDPTQLPAEELETYRKALRGEPLDEDEPGLGNLLSRGVLLYNTHETDRYVPTPTRYVENQLYASAQKALSSLAEDLARIPSVVRELEAEQQRHGHTDRAAGAVLLESVPDVNAETIRTIRGASREILTAQPGARPPKVLKGALPRDLDAAQRGVTVNTIYRTSGRTNPTQRAWVKTMTAAGAQVRTLGENFPRMIIVDRQHAFFEAFDHEGAVIQGMAWYSQEPAVCEALAAHFRVAWERSDAWVPEDQGDENDDEQKHKTTRVQRTILRSIVAGRSHLQIGKDLGLSERTVTAHVSKLRKCLGFETVPQLTHWWATSPERLLP